MFRFKKLSPFIRFLCVSVYFPQDFFIDGFMTQDQTPEGLSSNETVFKIRMTLELLSTQAVPAECFFRRVNCLQSKN